MLPFFESLLTQVKKRLTRKTSVRRSQATVDRRLKMESLESRRVLATVTGFTPTSSGFNVQLSEEISTVNLNLYDTQSQAAGAADVTLRGANVGNVAGSLVVSGTTLRFVSTGGPLAPDTYTVTLRSADNGITDLADGGLLDGEFSGTFPSGNSTPGGNFVTTFTIGSAQQLVIGLPDFARGPTQPINVPATGSGIALPTGLPIQFSNAAGITSFSMTLNYNPALLNISEVQLGADAPTGSQIQSNILTPGTVTIAFFSLNPLAAGQADLVNLVASIPEDAPYGSADVLRISAIDINSGSITATADDAIQIVAFPGDANANRRYDAEDARLIARVGVGLDTGFVINQPTGQATSTTDRLFPRFDPKVVADVTGVDGLSPLDASDVLRRVVGLPTINIPALPAAQTPLGISLSRLTVAENSTVGSTVGTFTTNDPDAGDTHTYTLVSGTGSTDNASFTISGNTLRTATTFNRATKDTYNIRVQTTDSTGRTFQQTFVITITLPNAAPTAIALSSSTVAENATVGTTIGSLSTTDSNVGDTHTYSIVSVDGNTNAAPFSISGNSLRIANTLDFDTKASYVVRIRTTDQGGLTFEQNFTVTVTNVNEAPTAIALSSTSVPNNSVTGTVIGNLSTTDPDTGNTHTYTLVTGTGSTDNASFSIQNNQLRAAATLSFGSRTSYAVRVRSTDAAGLFFEQTFTITQSNGNVAPTAIALSANSVAENAAVATVIGTLSSTDANSSDTHTYTLVSGTGDANNSLFTLSGNSLRTAAALNFETTPTLSIRVRSTDSGGLTFDQVLTINVTNVNEAPSDITLSSTSVANGQPSGTVVGLLGNNDPDANNTFTYTFVTGTGSTDNASFTINPSNQLVTAFAANQATKASYSIRIRVVDLGGLSTEKAFTIAVTATNVAPTAVALSTTNIPNGATIGSTVGTFTSSDANTTDVHTYSLVTGTGSTDNASFTILNNQLRTATAINAATKSSYSIRVRTTDNFGLTFEQAFTLTVSASNQAPTAIALSASSVAENAASGTVVGTLSSTDANSGDTHTYSLVTGTGDIGNGSFTIVGNQLRTAAALNFETTPTITVRVRSTDSGNATFDQVLTINVSNVNEAASDITLTATSIANAAPSGTIVGTLGTNDPDAGSTITYTFATGTGATDNGSFTINTSGQLVTNFIANQATKASYSVRLQATDAGGLSTQEAFTIAVTAANVAPTAIALSASSVAENAASGTVVGTLSSTDANSGDTHTYSLVTGTGDIGNGSFTIVGNQLRTAAALNFETTPTITVRVRSTDSGNATFDQVLTINVSNVNEAASDITLTATSIANAAPSGTIVGTLGTNDPDAGSTITYTFATGTGSTDNGSFTINTSGQLVTNFIANQATKASYSVRIQATDAGGLSTQEAFTITVTAANVAPTAIALSASSVAENAASGTVVGTLSSTDANSGDTHSYLLVTGTGSTNNGSFTIVGNELRTSASFDFETQPTLSIRVRSTDSGSATFEQVLTINVSNVNEAASDITLTATSIANAAPSGTIVGTLGTNDPDAGSTITYTFATGTGSTDNGSFTINTSGQLVTNFIANQATKASYSVRIQATDAGGLSTQEAFTITVTAGNVAPTAIALSASNVAENAASGTVVGTLSSTDANSGDTHSYLLVTGTGSTNNGSFTIVGNELRTSASFDFETQPTLSIRVRSTDSGSATFEQVLTINVSNVNEAASDITLTATSIANAAPSGTIVGTLGTNDPDAGSTITYTFATGTGSTDNGSFTINTSGQLVTNFIANQATKASYSVRIQATDAGGLSTQEAFTITVTTGNVAPTAIALSASNVAENAASGTVVGTLSSTDANSGDTHTYLLVTGTGSTNNGSFTIVGNELRTSASFDFETQPTLSIRVRSTDSGSATFEQVLTINVSNVNEAASDITLTATSIANAAPSGTIVGTLGTNDPDAGSTITYTFATGTGSTDNGSFTINTSGQLVTNFIANQATKASYAVRIQATDAGGLSTQEAFTITVNPPNVAPTAIALSASSVAENAASGTVVGTLSSTDANSGDTHSYLLVTGTGSTNNGSFTIVGNELRTSASFDFETQPTLSIRVQSTDSGSATFEQVLTINVTNVNEAASDITLTATSIADAAPSGTIVGTLGSNDPDAGSTITYDFVTGTGSADNGSFTINPSGQLVTGFVANQATKATYLVRVSATDAGGLSTEEAFTITVNPPNVAPTAIALSTSSVAENAASGTLVGTLSSTDANSGDTHSYLLVTGTGSTNNGSFTIVGNELRTSASFDFETQPTLSIRVQSTDGGGLMFEQVLTINVTNVNEAASDITLTATSIADAAPSGTIVGTLGSNDPDAGSTITYDFVTGTGSADNGSFTINPSGQLVTGFVANQATKATYLIRVSATDAGGLSTEEAFTITVNPPNVAPTAIALSTSSVAENAASGTLVGTLSSTDANSGDTHSYLLVTGTGSTNNGSFTIVGNELRTSASFDFETQPTLSIRVQSTDGGGLMFEQVLTINVTNVNEAASDITLTATSIADAAPSGTIVGTLGSNDPDAGSTITYDFVTGTGSADNGSFTINPSGQLVTGFVANQATKATYLIRVSATDAGGLSTEEAFTITVNPPNVAPTAIALSTSSVAENAASGTLVGTLSSTDANSGDTHSYLLVTGTGSTNNGSFTIVGNELRTSASFDFETQPTLSIRVQSTDAGGLMFEQVLTINVTNVNEAASDITLTATSIVDAAPSGTIVGTLGSNDPDAGSTITYDFVTGTGSADNGSFTINPSGQLVTGFVANLATKATYLVRVSATDAGGLSTEEAFTITVVEANVAPTALALSTLTINENEAAGTTVGTFSTTDGNASQTHTHQLISGTGDTDNGSFTIVGNQLQTSAAFDFETRTSYSIRVETSDPEGLTFEQTFTITVTDVNEEPTDVDLSDLEVAEAQPSGTLVGDFSSVDPDAGSTFTYSLVTGDGDNDNSSFTVVNGQLLTADSFDQATKDTYSIRVQTEDAGGLILQKILTITISESNVAPTDLAISNLQFPAESPVGTTVGTFSTTDSNVIDQHTYELIAGTGDDDNGLFVIEGNVLRIAATIDYNTQTTFSIRVLSQDRYGLTVERVINLTLSPAV